MFNALSMNDSIQEFISLFILQCNCIFLLFFSNEQFSAIVLSRVAQFRKNGALDYYKEFSELGAAIEFYKMNLMPFLFKKLSSNYSSTSLNSETILCPLGMSDVNDLFLIFCKTLYLCLFIWDIQ